MVDLLAARDLSGINHPFTHHIILEYQMNTFELLSDSFSGLSANDLVSELKASLVVRGNLLRRIGEQHLKLRTLDSDSRRSDYSAEGRRARALLNRCRRTLDELIRSFELLEVKTSILRNHIRNTENFS